MLVIYLLIIILLLIIIFVLFFCTYFVWLYYLLLLYCIIILYYCITAYVWCLSFVFHCGFSRCRSLSYRVDWTTPTIRSVLADWGWSWFRMHGFVYLILWFLCGFAHHFLRSYFAFTRFCGESGFKVFCAWTVLSFLWIDVSLGFVV